MARKQVEVTCCNPACGKKFMKRKDQADAASKTGARLFCDSKCFGEATRGENSPSWRGGITNSESVMRSRKRYPERERARRKAHAAMAKGEIEKPGYCEDCGEIGPVDMHHENYHRPLDVVFVCKPCHYKRHKEMKRKGRLRQWGAADRGVANAT